MDKNNERIFKEENYDWLMQYVPTEISDDEFFLKKVKFHIFKTQKPQH